MECLRFEAGCMYKLQIFFIKFKVLTGCFVTLDSVVPVSTIKKKEKKKNQKNSNSVQEKKKRELDAQESLKKRQNYVKSKVIYSSIQ